VEAKRLELSISSMPKWAGSPKYHFWIWTSSWGAGQDDPLPNDCLTPLRDYEFPAPVVHVLQALRKYDSMVDGAAELPLAS